MMEQLQLVNYRKMVGEQSEMTDGCNTRCGWEQFITQVVNEMDVRGVCVCVFCIPMWLGLVVSSFLCSPDVSYGQNYM